MSQEGSKIGAIMHDYHQVSFGRSVHLSPQCTVCGSVEVGDEVSIFAGAHLRGDCAPITIGHGTNIQENCCLHVSAGMPLTIGRDCTVGHGAIVHGCTIGDNVLVGMGSIVMDGARIGDDCLIAVGAIVTEGKEFPSRSLIMGVPARAVRELSNEQLDSHVTSAALDYQKVGEAMEDDGLLMEAPQNATVWPLPGDSQP